MGLCRACREGLSLTTVVAGARRRKGLRDHDGGSKEGRGHSVGNQLEPALLAGGPADRGALLAGKADWVAERQLVVVGSPAVPGRALCCCAAHAAHADVEGSLPVGARYHWNSPVPVCAHDRAAAGSPRCWPHT